MTKPYDDDQPVDIPFTIYPDAYGDNADWTKQSWDLPPYKSEAFFSIFGEQDLPLFRTWYVYRNAVKRGWIVNDEWVGEQDGNEQGE